MVQQTHYDAWGVRLPLFGNPDPYYGKPHDRYRYNGKEYVSELSWYEYGFRIYDPVTARFISIDPLAEKNHFESGYVFSHNNPVRFIDPDGRDAYDVILKGKEAQAAFVQLQASVQKDLTLSMDKSGKVSYTQNGTGKLSKDSKQLVNAIDDHSIVVNVNAENTTTTKSGNLYIGGAFSGNIVTKTEPNMVDAYAGNFGPIITIVAEQEINPSVLNTISTAHGKPGADVLHEVTEAYQGGLLSLKSGQSSGVANDPNSVYPTAHNRATSQSGSVFETLYDASNNILQMNPNGSYPAGVKRVEW